MTLKNNEFLEIFAAHIFSNTMIFDNFQRKFPLIPGRLLNVLCSYSLLPVSTGKLTPSKEVFETHLGELIKH